MLPTIKIGNEEFHDISGIVTANRYVRPTTDGIAIHHTVGQTAFPDKNFNGTTMDEEIAHIVAINEYHITKGYGGFGYNGIAFESGRCYVVGQMNGARAHVANHNNHLLGLVAAGTFTDNAMPMGLFLALARMVKAAWVVYGQVLVGGHMEFVTDPAWATSCPGNGGMRSKLDIVRAARVLLVPPSDPEQAKAAIKAALLEAYNNADLPRLAAQIAYITGGKFCG